MDPTPNTSILAEMSVEVTAEEMNDGLTPEEDESQISSKESETPSNQEEKESRFNLYEEVYEDLDSMTAYQKHLARYEYGDRIARMGLKLQEYCRANYLPIFNHPRALQRIVNMLV
jgi:hypothetical protein